MRRMKALRFRCPHCTDYMSYVERVELYKEYPDRGVKFDKLYAWRWPCCGHEELIKYCETQQPVDMRDLKWTQEDPNKVWENHIQPYTEEYEAVIPDRELYGLGSPAGKVAEEPEIPIEEDDADIEDIKGLPTINEEGRLSSGDQPLLLKKEEDIKALLVEDDPETKTTIISRLFPGMEAERETNQIWDWSLDVKKGSGERLEGDNLFLDQPNWDAAREIWDWSLDVKKGCGERVEGDNLVESLNILEEVLPRFAAREIWDWSLDVKKGSGERVEGDNLVESQEGLKPGKAILHRKDPLLRRLATYIKSTS